MFEDSLISSAATRRNAGRTRWIVLASIAIQGCILAGFIIVPLLWPETLPQLSVAPKVSKLVLNQPAPKPQPRPVRVETTSNAPRIPASRAVVMDTHARSIISRDPAPTTLSDEPTLSFNHTMGSTSATLPGGSIFGSNPGPAVVAAAPRSTTPYRISSGVAKGSLIEPIQPVYPRIAIVAHVEGTVVVTATIDKQGRITGLQVVSGPDLLKTAAIDAVKQARYHPFLLNGEPTEVITTISVTFHLSA